MAKIISGEECRVTAEYVFIYMTKEYKTMQNSMNNMLIFSTLDISNILLLEIVL